VIPVAAQRSVLQMLRSSLRGRTPELRSLIAWSAVQALPALLSGRLVAEAVDRGFLAHRTTEGLAWLAVLAIALLVGSWGTRETYRRLAAIVEPFRDDLVKSAVQGALRDATRSGARPDNGAVGRLTRHIEIAREAYASVFMILLSFLLTTGSALIGLVTLRPFFLLLVLPPLAAGLGLFLVILRRTAKRRRQALLAEERIAEETAEFVSGIRDVVASGAEQDVSAAADEAIDEQARATIDVARFTAVQTCAIAIGGWLPVLLILVTGSSLRSSGASAGVILGALTYVLQAVQPALQTLIRGIGSNGLWLLVTLDRIAEAFGSAEPSANEPPTRPSLGQARPAHRPSIEMRGVTFGYGPEPVIAKLDLRVPYGDHLTIVGPSGVGKSTLAALMSGILVPQAGQVSLGGAPIGAVDPSALPDHRVLIPQEAYVFAGTLWENLTYLRADATERQVERAVRNLGLKGLVGRLGGYGGDVAKGTLSAGEKQLISLARAYLSTASLVVLDEAACHLDALAEARVEEAFSRRRGTLVVIAHRISSARRAARVLVMDGTRITLGTHESLRAECRLYRDLVGHWEEPVGRPDDVILAPSPRCLGASTLNGLHR
jgi:ABC-type multidrug transport system fused ATPase/permease subunit